MVSKGSEKNHTAFWGPKKGQKWPKMAKKHIEIFNFSEKKRDHTGGIWGRDGKRPHFSPFFIEPLPNSRTCVLVVMVKCAKRVSSTSLQTTRSSKSQQ